jgi:hypothetical protein
LTQASLFSPKGLVFKLEVLSWIFTISYQVRISSLKTLENVFMKYADIEAEAYLK